MLTFEQYGRLSSCSLGGKDWFNTPILYYLQEGMFTMQINVKYGIHVGKPPADVFAFLADPDKMPLWQSTNFQVKGKKQASGQGKLQRGTKVQDHRKVLGKDIDGEWEVIEHEQDKKLVLKVSQGPVPWQMTYTLAPADGGTFLSAEGGGDLGQVPMSSVAAARSCQRLLEQDLATLADILEK
jgi:uncharacterized protein YndB with AHSA1/START domain